TTSLHGWYRCSICILPSGSLRRLPWLGLHSSKEVLPMTPSTSGFSRTSTPTTKWLSEARPLSESSSSACSSPRRAETVVSASDEWRDGLRTQTSICRWSHKQPSQGIPESFRGRSADNEVGGTPMSLVQTLMLVVLVVMFIAATKWPINIGIMGLVGAFV